jgi:hypothetical protein
LSEAQKLLFIDIETSPALIASFSIRAPHAQAVWIEKHSFMLCFAARWAHEKRIRVHSLPDYKTFKKDIHSDIELCSELSNYLTVPGVIACAHNGDRFDLPFIHGRMWVNKQKPPPPIPTIDTLKIAKRLRLDSHKLDILGRYKHLGHKRPNTGKDLWADCYRGDVAAHKEMGRYCAQDVNLLSTVYDDLAPWMKRHPVLFDDGCPVCGSQAIHRRGRVRQTTKFQFNCTDCGHWWTAKP